MLLCKTLLCSLCVWNVGRESAFHCSSRGFCFHDEEDILCKQAKRIIKGKVDVLAKPLEDGIAVCFFNKGGNKKNFKFDPSILIKDDYIAANDIQSYEIQNIIGEITQDGKTVCVDIPKHGVVVYKYKKWET